MAYWLSFHSAIGNHILFGSKQIRESLDLYKDALSDKLTLFRVAFVSCDTLCHVFLDVVVEERVVVFVETGRSEEFGHIGDGSFCGGHNHATRKVYLCVNADIFNLILTGLLVQHERTLVLAGRCIRLVEFPVQWVDAHSARQHHAVISLDSN